LPGEAAEKNWEEFLGLITSKEIEGKLALQFGDLRLPVKNPKVRARPKTWPKWPWIWLKRLLIWLKRPGMWLKRCAVTVWRNRVYDEYQSHAEGIKAILQILTGIAFTAFLAYQIVADLNQISLQDTADHALKTVCPI
jgi:hypothetical protein